MSKTKREYTVEFKQKAVELGYARGNAAEVCRELGLHTPVPGRWRREAGEYGPDSFPGKGNPQVDGRTKGLAEPGKKLRDTGMERDILKKAIAVFPDRVPSRRWAGNRDLSSPVRDIFE